MTSSTDGLDPPSIDLNSLVLFWMPGVVVPLHIKFFQTSDVVSTNQAKGPFILLNNKILHKQLVAKHPPSWRIFVFANTTCFAKNCLSLRLNYSLNCYFYELQNKYYYCHRMLTFSISSSPCPTANCSLSACDSNPNTCTTTNNITITNRVNDVRRINCIPF